jgi:hypothetical protein
MRWLATILAGALALQPVEAWAPARVDDDPLNLVIVRTDVERFWKAFDSLDERPARNPFVPYVNEGSPGLRDFVPDERIKSAEALHELVASERAYYSAIRQDSLSTEEFDARIRASFLALKELYPEARFPPVYYVIGRTTSGGTATPSSSSSAWKRCHAKR